ncbi:Helix-turn-helix domain-containing protein [Curtobacterium sp. YR515]|nr:Helix-turn-helix domain-containing protein [Curtobacterium sp. YR515]
MVARPASVQRAEALGLTVSRVHEPTGLFDRRYVPSLSVVLRGRKRSVVGDDDQVWGRERFIITPVDLPVVAGVLDTAGSDGFVSAVWKLDPVVVGEVVASMSSTMSSTSRTDLPRLGEWTAPLADAVSRLLALLDAPEDIPVLFPLVSREIVLRLLQTAQAPRITAALDRAGAEAGLVAGATALLTERMDEPWTMERLARELRVSESTLFARFKQATGMSPAQYLKRTRLGEARRRMVLHADTAARAAAAVGYRSASHFSRDYREAYGRPPAADAVVAREQLALAPAV